MSRLPRDRDREDRLQLNGQRRGIEPSRGNAMPMRDLVKELTDLAGEHIEAEVLRREQA